MKDGQWPPHTEQAKTRLSAHRDDKLRAGVRRSELHRTAPEEILHLHFMADRVGAVHRALRERISICEKEDHAK
jgi:hypothetical protein